MGRINFGGVEIKTPGAKSTCRAKMVVRQAGEINRRAETITGRAVKVHRWPNMVAGPLVQMDRRDGQTNRRTGRNQSVARDDCSDMGKINLAG
jgi:hypothetical protein